MYIDFTIYSDDEIKQMVKQAFDTIEKTGVWDDKTDVCKAWNRANADLTMLSVSSFLNELYYEFATRYALHRNYKEYLKEHVDMFIKYHY